MMPRHRFPRQPGPLRVLLVADDLQNGGVSQVVLDLAEALLRGGHTVAVAGRRNGELWGSVPTGVPIHYLTDIRSPLRLLIDAVTLARLSRREGYEVIHAHQRGVALSARLASALTSTPVIEHVHNIFPPSGIEKWLSFHGDVLVGCGTFVSRMLADDFGRRTAKIRTVQNGVQDLDSGRRRASGSAPESRFHIIGVGRLTDQKDPLRFVQVVAHVVAQSPEINMTATWYGDGPLRRESEALAGSLGLDDVLKFAGNIPDLTSAYAGADLLLLTSRWEGLPLVALEAMSAGCAIALPDVGSCSDAFGDAPVGLLYDPAIGNTELARVIAESLTPTILTDWSRNARARYLAAFTIQRMVASMFAIYRQTVRMPAPTHEPAR